MYNNNPLSKKGNEGKLLSLIQKTMEAKA